MANGKEHSDNRPAAGSGESDSSVHPAEPGSQFKRQLVPLDEYAAREGLSGETVEKQGRLGVVQIRKFRGRKFVVDVPFSQSGFGNEDAGGPKADAKAASVQVRRRWSAGAVVAVFLLMAGLCAAVWLYVDARMKLRNLDNRYMTLRLKYDDVVHATANAGTVQSELASSRAELGRIQSRVSSSRVHLEQIRGSLSRARRDLETIQGELTGIQGQISVSRAEIESVQNGLNSDTDELQTLYRSNVKAAAGQ